MAEGEACKLDVSENFAVLENLNGGGKANWAWKNIRRKIKIST